MRIQYLSDTHIENLIHQMGGMSKDDLEDFERVRNTDSDILILAGDIYYKGRSIKHAADLANGRQCLVIAGNHEYYTGRYQLELSKLRRRAARVENVHFLENEAVEIDGVIFLGCTLWTSLCFYEEGQYKGLYRQAEVVNDLEEGMNDYRVIKWSPYRPLQPFDTLQLHKDSVTWLRSQFKVHRGKKIVVITHHAPSILSVQESYHQDVLTAAYASHLDELIMQSGAKLWIHGHVHDRLDYMIGETRVLCNCRGYDAEFAKRIGFDPQAVVEI